jgi:hypothetical protein
MPLSAKIQNYVDERRVTPEQASRLDEAQLRNLESDRIRGLIVDGTLTFERALGLNEDQFQNLDSAPICSLIDQNGALTLWQALSLFMSQSWNPDSTEFIANKTLTVEQAMGLTNEQRSNLEPEAIRGLIADGKLTLEQAMELTDDQSRNLSSAAICGLIADGNISLEDAMELNFNQYNILRTEGIRTLIANRTLPIEQVMGLHDTQLAILADERVRNLIANEIITVDQAMLLGEFEQREATIAAFQDVNTQQRLRNGELTFWDFLVGRVALGNPNAQQPQPGTLNNSQSTHTASVHRTVSESATRLTNRYPEVMGSAVLNSLITTITNEINALPAGNPKNEAAKRCVARLAAPEYAYTDHSSGVNSRELLALSWLAIHDNNARIGTLEDATGQFIEGLYEIQRGYNLSAAGVDMQGADSSICSGGTFNKLMEKLNGVHPDVVIKMITPQLFALKLPIVVREEVHNYLASKASPATMSELTQFTDQIKKIEEEGIGDIWDAIKDKVSTRLFDEFGSLYANENDPKFTAFIDAGTDIELGPLPSYQKQVSESEGYREYCRATMNSYRTMLNQNRQDSEPDLGEDEQTQLK